MAVPAVTLTRVAVPGNLTTTIRLSYFALGGFRIGLVQPVEGPDPRRLFLRRFGEGIHHLGFSTASDINRVIARLQRMGGTWTVGGPGVQYAIMDFRNQLGAAFGISADNPAAERPNMKVDASLKPSALGRQRVTNIGILVCDLEEAMRGYADVLGLGVSSVRTVEMALPGVSIVSHGAARLAYLKQRGIAVKLIEPTSGGPLREFLERHGNRAHHIGFEVGAHFNDIVRHLESLGGTIMLGRADLGYALVDLTSTLGVVLEVSGSSAR